MTPSPRNTARWPAILLATAVAASLLLVPRPARADTPESCGNTILVLDESGSLAPHEATMRSAVNSFLNPLIDTNAAAAIVEFGSAATKVFEYTSIGAANIAGTFGPYINATSSGEVYDPPSQLGPFTNWDDALDEVTQINADVTISPEPAPVVLFLTDGDPTAYNLDKSGESGGVDTTNATVEGLNRAIEEADEIRVQGSHIIAVGLGAGLTNPASIDRLKQVSGPNVYDGSGILDLDTADVVLVPDIADLPDVMALIATAMCADPGISVVKNVSSPTVIAGTEVTYSIDVTNTGNIGLHDVVLDDPSVPACSQVIGDLAVGETVTVQCTATVWAPVTNTATATGSDPFGTPVENDGSATTTLLATGTGTPGFWKNHLDVWPVANDIVLIGDWNHNWVCDADETCLELTTEEALAALSTPPKGDMTWNLGRPLLAAWLNVSAGNESSCISETIDLAAGWLQANPLDSEVKGSDPAWGEASSWAGLLDDYNNGRLCAEHRDSEGDSDTNGATGETSTSNGGNSQGSSTDAPATDTDEKQNSAGGNPPPHSKGKGKNES